jgi:ribosome-associated toxin RatA of RatAB toxin-antitoxin module
MERIVKTIEVRCPVRTVYNQWTQFEEFPHFMSGVKEVRQIDDTHVHWHAEVWGVDREWDSEITEQVPDLRIAWRSVSGPYNAGTVRFEAVDPERTRVKLEMAYEPEGTIENMADKLGVLRGRVEETLEDFKEFIEKRGRETGAWRGEVHQAEKQRRGDAPGKPQTARRSASATGRTRKARRRGATTSASARRTSIPRKRAGYKPSSAAKSAAHRSKSGKKRITTRLSISVGAGGPGTARKPRMARRAGTGSRSSRGS